MSVAFTTLLATAAANAGGPRAAGGGRSTPADRLAAAGPGAVRVGHTVEYPADAAGVSTFRVWTDGRAELDGVPVWPAGGTPGGFEPYGSCPEEVVTHTNFDFDNGGPLIVQAGFAQSEIAAASYVVPAGDFPLRVDVMEMVFATSNATVTTTTRWSVMIWEGTPNTGSLVDTFSSDDVILPHLVMPPGTNATNIQVVVDPQDPEPIILTDIGNHTFTIGFRIDQHNQPPANPCTTAPPTCCNAFPTTDTSLQQLANNWLYGINCGPAGCPPNGGWASFANLSVLCRPSGDWIIRATYTPLNCLPMPTITSVEPESAVNVAPVHLTITGTNFVAGQTSAQLIRSGFPIIAGQNLVVGGGGTTIDADFNVTGAAPGPWTLQVTVGGTSVNWGQPFVIEELQPPSVTGFAPGASANTAIINATVNGTHFIPGATTVDLSLGTAYTVEGVDVAVASATELTADFDLRCVPTGWYHCTVTTPGGSATLLNAINVTPASFDPPVIFGVDPASLPACPGPQTVTIFGSDFQDGTEVALSRAGFDDVPADVTTYVAQSILEASFNLDGVAVGSWDVRVTNPDCQTAEAADAFFVDSCVPSVESISPTSANNHQTNQSVSVGGQNFVAGATLRLTRAGQSDIVATNVSVPNAQTLTASLNLFLVATGPWNVVVTNPGGASDTLANGFTVTAGPAPTVSFVNPNSATNCGVVHATIIGNPGNYLPGATVRLELSGQPHIEGFNVVRVDAFTLTADFDLTCAATTPTADKWDCRVTNPDGQSGLGVNKLNVTACAQPCCTKGDLNDDGLRDGDDVGAFVRVFINHSGTPTELCAADMAAPAGLDNADLASFVTCLITGACP